MAAHKELNSEDEFKAAISEQGKFVLVFAYKGEFPAEAEGYAKQYEGKVTPYRVNVDVNPTAAKHFPETPTVVVFKDGQELKRVTGEDKEKYKEIAELFN